MVEHLSHVIVELGLVLLERQNIVSSLLYDRRRYLLLTPHCVNGHCAARHVQSLEQFGNRCDLVGVIVYLDLTENQAIGGCPRAHHVDR